MSEEEQLSNIINVILSPDNEARKKHEALLAQLLEKDVNQYMLVFLNLLNSSPRKDIRVFCSLHLRRLISDFASDSVESCWPSLAGATQEQIKVVLLQVLAKENESGPRKVLCDLIGELAATIKTMDKETRESCQEEGRQWESIMQHIWELLKSGSVIHMGSGLKILGVLFKYCSTEFAEHKEQLVPIFKQALEQENIRVKAAAIDALSEYIENVESEDCKPFIVLIPILLTNIAFIIEKDEDLGVGVMANLTNMIELETKTFKQHFVSVIDFLRMVAMNQQIETNSLKENALEMIVVLVEKHPKLSGKQQELIQGVFQAIFTYMFTCVEDPDEEWLRPPEGKSTCINERIMFEGFLQTKEEVDSREFSIKYCTDLFNRLIAALGQRQTLPVLSAMVQEMVTNNNWRHNFSALMALSQVGEHVGDINEIDPIVAFTLNFFKDEHPKVRHAALHCMGQLADDGRPHFQERYNSTVVPALINAFNDEIPRVLAHALAALTNFLEGCSKKGVEGSIAGILEPCLNFIDTGISLVKENAIATIAALAEASRQDFTPYWQKTAEIIFTVLKNINQREYKQLRAQAIECLTLIGDAVGRQEFKKAADEIIRVMIGIQQNHMEESDPQKLYLLAGWQRLSSLFKQDFTPYLSEILPSLFALIEVTIQRYESKQSSAQPDDEVYEAENTLGENPSGRSIHNTINTSESEEVVLAVKMISTFLQESGKGFLPFIDKAIEICTFLLAKSLNDNIRIAVAKALPGIINVLHAAEGPDKAYLIASTANLYLNLLWKLYSNELETGNLMTYVSSMKDVIKTAGRYMEEPQLAVLVDNIVSALKESDSRKTSNREELEDDQDIDEDQIAYLQEDSEKEDELHCVLAELIGVVFQTHKELTLPLAKLLLLHVLPNALKTESTPRIKKFGLILINNMVEHLGRTLMPNEMPLLSDILIKFTITTNSEVRDCAAYGLGALAETSQENFQSIAESCLIAILAGLGMKPTEEADMRAFWRAKTRVIMALGRIIKYQSKFVNLPEVVQIWLKNLPLAYHFEEARLQHEMLVDIILDENPSLIFGENGHSLPFTIKVFAQLSNTKLISETFLPKMKKVIAMLESNEQTRPVLQEAINALDENLKAKLAKVLT